MGWEVDGQWAGVGRTHNKCLKFVGHLLALLQIVNDSPIENILLIYPNNTDIYQVKVC